MSCNLSAASSWRFFTVLQATHAHELQRLCSKFTFTTAFLQATHAHELQQGGDNMDKNYWILQATHAHELQPTENPRARASSTFKPRMRMSCNRPNMSACAPSASFKPRMRMSCNRMYQERTGQRCTFKPRMRMSCNCTDAPYNGSCTDYYVHLNLFECLARPSMSGLTATFSILGREVAPYLVRTGRKPLFTPTSHEVFLR